MSSPKEVLYDVAVIGGGLIGCAVLRELATSGYRCILLEQHPDVLTGASAGNSGHLSYRPSAECVESKAVAVAKHLNDKFYSRLDLPMDQFDGIIVAQTKTELDRLPGIVQEAHMHGVMDVKLLSSAEVLRLEPHMNRSVLGGVLVPGECAVDPFLTPITMLHEGRRAGGEVKVDCAVQSGIQGKDKTWCLDTRQGKIHAKVVVNAAGLYGDKVESICRSPQFRIQPRKGEAVIYPKSAKALAKHMILQVPTPEWKGVIIYPTVYGNIVVGPTLEHVTEREIPLSSTPSITQRLESYAQNVFPGLKEFRPVGTMVGLRPATGQKDYHLEALPDKHWVTVAGIRSTGLTNCLAIAEFVRRDITDTIRVAPSRPPCQARGQAVPWHTDRGTIVLDGAEYTVTHPICQFGLWNKPFKKSQL